MFAPGRGTRHPDLMGFDTYVTIGGRMLVGWRKQTGWLPRLLFQREETEVVGGPGHGIKELRFTSTAEKCLDTLEANGFGWHSTVASYAGVRSSSIPEAMLWGRFAADLRHDEPWDAAMIARVEERLDGAGRAASAREDLESLGALWASVWLDDAIEEVILLGELIYDEPIETSSSFLWRATDLAESSGRPPFSVLRALVAVNLLFSEARMVAWPLAICTLLRHLPPHTPVVYELSEGIREFDIDDATSAYEFLRKFWEESGVRMTKYAEKIGLLYGTLAAMQTGLGRSYWLGRSASALGRLDDLNLARTAENRKERGDALEDLVAAIVNTEEPELRLMVKNFRTEEEEIDLILANGLAHPFWASFGSPTIFVECKNWVEPVGVAELRVFESKMEDRRAVAKIGIFVSMSGFTAPFLTRLKEIQARGVGVIFAVSGEDLRAVLVTRQRLTDWLRSEGFMRAFSR